MDWLIRIPTQSTLKKMKLNKDQQHAFDAILEAAASRQGQTLLLEGPAGTGKTAVMGAVLREYIRRNPKATNPNCNMWGVQLPGKLCVAAMSHKAKGELANSLARENITNHPVITCDQLLKARPVVDPVTREKVPHRQQLPLDSTYEFIVIDETSMLSQQYYDWLLEWKHDWQTIVFVGDRAQLAPVQDGKLAKVFTQCDQILNLSQVMRHQGCILSVCNTIRTYGKGCPSFSSAKDDKGEVVVFDSEDEFCQALYEEAAKDHNMKVVCHTNANVRKINDTIHKLRNPGVDAPFVRDEHVMSARAIETPDQEHPVVPSSMDMQIVDCVAASLDLGMAQAEHLLGMSALQALLGSDGAVDVYRCHKVQAIYEGNIVEFFVSDHHKGEQKRYEATQSLLKEIADDRTKHNATRQALNRYINWREKHFASVHLSTGMTIHKSQGSSFLNVWVYPDIPKRNSEATTKLAYVACSRATKRLTLCNV